MLIDNHSILPLLEDAKFLQKNRFKALDRPFPIIAPTNQLPPIQKMLPSGTTITSVQMIDSMGNSEEILSLLQLAGLKTVSFTGYDMLIYPSKVLIPFSGLKTGKFEFIFSDGTNQWHSEMVIMCENTDDFIKVEYSHSDNISIRDGQLVYQDEYFWNVIYFPVLNGKPNYPESEKVDERLDVEFTIQQISQKQIRFSLMLPEFLTDAIRTINMHDFKYLTVDGIRYKIIEFDPQPNWDEKGDLADTTIEVFLDDIIVINAQSIS